MPYTSFVLSAFVFWPVITILAALANMLIWWQFSASEIILDYFVGGGIGVCFWAFASVDPTDRTWWRSGLMMLSQGFMGVLSVVSVLPSPASMFWFCAGSTLIGTIIASSLDHAAIALGGTMSAGGVALSLVLFLIKAPACILSTAVGLLIFIVGLCHAGAAHAGAGFLGGVAYEEWDQQASPIGVQATTIGATVHCWRLRFCQNMCHELNHSRQCIYMHDFMIPTWAVGFLVSGGNSGEPNPVEHVAYGIQGPAQADIPDGMPCIPCGGTEHSAPAPAPAPSPASHSSEGPAHTPPPKPHH